jgi:hypothetical protein
MPDQFPHRSDDFLQFMADRQAQPPAAKAPKAGTQPVTRDAEAAQFTAARVKDLMRFIGLRETARQRKAEGKFPYSKDPIIARFRFCNVRREDDRVTRWVAFHWRAAHGLDPDLWFAMCVARLALNDIDSMTQLGYPVPWKPKAFLKMVEARQAAGQRVYGPAYMIATPGWSGPKHQFLVEKLLTPLWQNRRKLRPIKGDTLAGFHARLTAMHGVGSFTGGQVVADLKYVPPLDQASDWWDWATPGPGSRRGLNRVCDRGLNDAWRDQDWLATLTKLRLVVNGRLPEPLHAQDLQNCLCEFDKYERARLQEGTPKQLYTPYQSA